MDVELRHNPTDSETLSAVSEMLETSLEEDLRYPFEGLLPYFENGSMELYAAFDKGNDVGFAVVIPHGKLLYILFLVVNAKYRSEGYGRKIIDAMRETYPDKSLVLDCEEELVPFYEHVGIKDSGYKMEFRNILLYVMCESELCLDDFVAINKVLGPLEKDDDTDFIWIEPDGTRYVIAPGCSLDDCGFSE